MDRVRAEVLAKPGELIRLTEFFKPGFDEITSAAELVGTTDYELGPQQQVGQQLQFRCGFEPILRFSALDTSKLLIYRPRTYRFVGAESHNNAG